jgi:FkbM family methyltransferase
MSLKKQPMQSKSFRQPLRLAIAQAFCRLLPPLLAQRLRLILYPLKSAYSDNVLFAVRAQTGLIFTHTTGDFHAYPFAVYGYYDWRNVAVAIATCAETDVIVEVGANIGTETISYASIVNKGRVYAFEPVQSNFEVLSRVININSLDNTRIFPVAVGEKCGEVAFAAPVTQKDSGIGHVIVDNQSAKKISPTSIIKVPCITLDSMIDCLPEVRIIFIDAEGAEISILQGANELIKRGFPHILLEASPKHLKRAGTGIDSLYENLHTLDYLVFRIGRFGLIRVEPDNYFHRASNWFCVHHSKRQCVERVSSTIRACAVLPCIQSINPLTRKPTR